MKLSSIFFLSIGIAIGVCATMAFHVDRPGPDAGDWLAFAGALIGVVLTIGGTLWLESYRASRGDREGVELIRTSLAEIKKALDSVNADRAGEDIATFRPTQIQRERDLAKSCERFLYARHFVPKKNFKAWQSMEELQGNLATEKELIEREAQLIEEHGDNENVLGVNLSKMYEVRERLLPQIQSAESTLN